MPKSFALVTLLTVAFASIMMHPRPTRVLFFGDSITEMGVSPDGYITRLRSMLQASGKADQFELIGAGIGGNKIYDLYLRLEADVISRSPDLVVIFIGVNDVWHKRTTATGTDADKFVRFYEAIIARLGEKGIRMILATPALIGEKKDCSNDLDGELNHYCQLIRELALKHQLPLVDLRKECQRTIAEQNPADAEKGILTTDGVHFSSAGNQLTATLFFNVLTQEPH